MSNVHPHYFSQSVWSVSCPMKPKPNQLGHTRKLYLIEGLDGRNLVRYVAFDYSSFTSYQESIELMYWTLDIELYLVSFSSDLFNSNRIFER